MKDRYCFITSTLSEKINKKFEFQIKLEQK